MKPSSTLNVSNAELVKFLSSTAADESPLEKLKIKYRPWVCPFNELLDVANGAKSVYDIGAGSGQFCALVAEFTDVADVRGIEIDQRLVGNAEKLTAKFSDKKVTFQLFDGQTIPNDIAEYDLIYMIDVYHHIPRRIRSEFMKQVYAKMKPGAKIMFKDIDAGSPLVLCNKVHDLVFAREFGHEISNATALDLFKSLGFRVLENHKKRVLWYPQYFVLAEK